MHFWFMVKYYIVQPLKKGKQNLGKDKIKLTYYHLTAKYIVLKIIPASIEV